MIEGLAASLGGGILLSAALLLRRRRAAALATTPTAFAAPSSDARTSDLPARLFAWTRPGFELRRPLKMFHGEARGASDGSDGSGVISGVILWMSGPAGVQRAASVEQLNAETDHVGATSLWTTRLAAGGGGKGGGEGGPVTLSPLMAFADLDLEDVWDGGTPGVLLALDAESGLWRLDVARGARTFICAPPARIVGDMCAISDGRGGVAACCFVGPESARSSEEVPSEEVPLVWPKRRRELQLHVFHSGRACRWEPICQASAESCGLDMAVLPRAAAAASAAPTFRIVFGAYLNHVPEEAERGEYFKVDTSDGAVCQITTGAGRIEEHGIAISSDGARAVLHANFESKRPITTHMRLWSIDFSATTTIPTPTKQSPTLISGNVEGFVELFGFCGADTRDVYVVTSHKSKTYLNCLCSCGGGKGGCGIADHNALQESNVSPSCPPLISRDKTCWIEESPREFARLVIGRSSSKQCRIAPLPHPQMPPDLRPAWNDFVCTRVEWRASDGKEITGFLFSASAARLNESMASTPLLVHAHGGPAISMPLRRSDATNATRYPYRHYLAAGFNVFTPCFRGTLGFGDGFAQANIGGQGISDLDDLVTGVHALKLRPDTPVGIFGGSYGGYMTLRALSEHPKMFAAGCAMYGFVHNRFMTFEGGDFTWETEYLGSPDRWPLSDHADATRSDIFDKLCDISAPTLLLHGEDDDICTPSQSHVAYHVISRKGPDVPCELVVYPGEGHGFCKPHFRRDRCERSLAWFLKHMKVDVDGGVAPQSLLNGSSRSTSVT